MAPKKKKGKRKNFFSKKSKKDKKLFNNKSDSSSAAKKFIENSDGNDNIELTQEGQEHFEKISIQQKLKSTESPILLKSFNSKFEMTPVDPDSFITMESEIIPQKNIRYAQFSEESIWLFKGTKALRTDFEFNIEQEIELKADLLNYPPYIDKDGIYFIGPKKVIFTPFEGDDKKSITFSGRSASKLYKLGENFLILVNFSKIISLNSELKENWSFSIEEYSLNEPTFLDDTIILTSSDGFVYQLDQNGELLWSYNTKSPIFASAMISENFILVSSTNGKVHVISKSDKDDIKYLDTGFPLLNEPIIINDRGYVSNRNFLYEIASEGDPLRNVVKLPEPIEKIIKIGDKLGVFTVNSKLLIINQDLTQYNILDADIVQKPSMVYNYLFSVNTAGNIIKTELV